MKTRIALKIVDRLGTPDERRYRQSTLAKAGKVYRRLPTSREAERWYNDVMEKARRETPKQLLEFQLKACRALNDFAQALKLCLESEHI